MKMKLILAAGLVAFVGCNRHEANPPATQSASTDPKPANAASTDPRKHLADSFAHLFDLLQKEIASHKPVDDWTHAMADAKSPEAAAGRHYHQAILMLLPTDNTNYYENDRSVSPIPPKDLHEVESSYKYASGRAALIDGILTRNAPDFAKRWTSGEFAKVLQAYGFGTLGGHSPLNDEMLYPQENASTSAPAMSTEQATQACVDLIMMLDREVLEPGLQTIRLRDEIDKVGDPIMLQELPSVYSLSIDQWFAGQGPANLDMPGDLKKLIVQWHPEIADPVFDLVNNMVIRRTVSDAQRKVKRDLDRIAKAEHDYVDRVIDEKDGYWTADVAGLYRSELNGQPITLLAAETARLDVHPANLASEAPLPPPAATKPFDELPKFGFVAIPVPDRSHFAVCAYPFGYGRIGRQSYLLTETNKLWVKDMEGKVVDRLPDNLEADGWAIIDPGETRELSKTIPKQGPVAQLKDPDPAIRVAALKRMAGIDESRNAELVDPPGGNSSAALHAIANAFDDDNHLVREQALNIMRDIGKPIFADAEPVIIKCLNTLPPPSYSEEAGDKRSDALDLAIALHLESDPIKACYKKLLYSANPNLAQDAAHALGVAVPNSVHFEGYWIADKDDKEFEIRTITDARTAGAPALRLAYYSIFDEAAIKSVEEKQGPQGPQVVITMTDQGANILATKTAANLDRQLALEIEGKVYYVGRIQAPLSNSIVITSISEAGAQQLVKTFADIQRLIGENK